MNIIVKKPTETEKVEMRSKPTWGSMNKPLISGRFTVEDIHKIREWHYEQRKSLGKEEYNKKLNKTVTEIIKEFPKVKVISL